MAWGRVEYFGGDRQLLGAFHLAPAIVRRSTAVLLCNPFGEEAARCHRVFRVLATHLQRIGFSTLRFDYSCTGDSRGSSTHATLAEWIEDIRVAAAALRDASGSSQIALVGLRLGATLATLACARGALRARHLVLWDPVVEGGAYMQELATSHHVYMRHELGSLWDERRRTHADGSPVEVCGTPITATMACELRAIDLAAETVTADHVSVVSTRPGPELEQLCALWPQARCRQIADATGWNSDAALNAMVVPMQVLQVVIQHLEGTAP